VTELIVRSSWPADASLLPQALQRQQAASQLCCCAIVAKLEDTAAVADDCQAPTVAEAVTETLHRSAAAAEAVRRKKMPLAGGIGGAAADTAAQRLTAVACAPALRA